MKGRYAIMAILEIALSSAAPVHF
ncbi:hypothetical protein RCA_02190 [Rickettsia canadensis str. CA410]|uniref:Uncharacterized protein n=1 Tax=Rickettsia canadensis str. CA410 TaxID=1105107 RepID=A0ABN4AA06_RICCA|nr:hypothetical protein RCA_02190 [Rickettsia canadensis str. CA410]